MISYVSLNDEFIEGIKKWFKKMKINPENQVAEVFAGTGVLGKKLGLPDVNITDSKAWEKDELLADILDTEWVNAANSVKKYDAIASIQMFYDNEDDIKILIMAAPTNVDDSAFKKIVELNRLFPGAKTLFIGPDKFVSGRGQVATEEFYKHTKMDSTDKFFLENVRQKYNKSDDFIFNNHGIESVPSLRKFVTCGNPNCICVKTNQTPQQEDEQDYNSHVVVDHNGKVYIIEDDDEDLS